MLVGAVAGGAAACVVAVVAVVVAVLRARRARRSNAANVNGNDAATVGGHVNSHAEWPGPAAVKEWLNGDYDVAQPWIGYDTAASGVEGVDGVPWAGPYKDAMPGTVYQAVGGGPGPYTGVRGDTPYEAAHVAMYDTVLTAYVCPYDTASPYATAHVSPYAHITNPDGAGDLDAVSPYAHAAANVYSVPNARGVYTSVMAETAGACYDVTGPAHAASADHAPHSSPLGQIVSPTAPDGYAVPSIAWPPTHSVAVPWPAPPAPVPGNIFRPAKAVRLAGPPCVGEHAV